MRQHAGFVTPAQISLGSHDRTLGDLHCEPSDGDEGRHVLPAAAGREPLAAEGQLRQQERDQDRRHVDQDGQPADLFAPDFLPLAQK